MQNTKPRVRWVLWCSWVVLLVLPWNARPQSAGGFWFMQLTDPQFGMYAADADFAQETANFEFAIASANRLKPAFVIVTGDLVNKTGDGGEVGEYLRIAKRLDPSIPLYNVAGNHDLGNTPTPESIARYTQAFGPDHYTFRCKDLVGIVLDSALIQAPNAAPELFSAQENWLKAELARAKEGGARHTVVFQHHPWFITSVDEPDGYDNIPRPRRQQYLDLFRQSGVSLLVSGHYHRDRHFRSGPLEFVVTGPIGMPVEDGRSGMRLFWVGDGGIEHRFYEMSQFPNRMQQ
jgi:serine/threonine-protein phosphatase CPPED1